MSVNLLDLVKGQLTDAVVYKASSFLGENEEATQKGLTHGIPALLGGLMSKAGTQSGASDLLGLITKPEISSVAGNIGELFGGSEKGLNLGGNLLNSVLGDKLGGITNLIGSVAGFKNSNSASGLLKMAAPLLMGVIGKQVGNSGVSGLMSLLGGQKDHLEKAVPAGFMDKIAGSLGLGSLGALTGNLTNSVNDTLKRAADKVEGVNSDVKKGGNKMLPILGILAGLVVAFFAWKSCGSDVKKAVDDGVENTVNTIEDGADAVKNGADAVVEKTTEGVEAVGGAIVEGADAIYNAGADLVGKTVKGFEYLGEFVSRKLKDGTELIVPNKGFEYQLVDFIEGDETSDKQTWFNLRRVLFETGSANLDTRSMSQIENVAKILKAYPNVHLKLGGYTDNTGNAETNKVLSGKRANAVLNALVEKGIDASRLSAEGYGVEHPVADNNTPEGRALNRRVAARVSKK